VGVVVSCVTEQSVEVGSFSGLNSGAQTTSLNLLILGIALSDGKVGADESDSIDAKANDAAARISNGGEVVT
jgi:hypothetical protein